MCQKPRLPVKSLLLLLIVCIGCGDERFSVVPVSGTVKLNGEPLADAFVTFDPRKVHEDGVAGPGSYGRTDSTGRFELETYDGREGAVLALHQVSIRTMLTEKDANGITKVVREELLPREFHEDSRLTFDVPNVGTDRADFDLKTRR